MDYYTSIINKQDRHWPLLPATEADNEIARLRAMVSQLQADGRAQRSCIKSLLLANAELQEVIRRGAKR